MFRVAKLGEDLEEREDACYRVVTRWFVGHAVQSVEKGEST